MDDTAVVGPKDQIMPQKDGKMDGDKSDNSVSGTFKTPSFVIPSRKKIQKSSAEADETFKKPTLHKGIEIVSSKNETKTITKAGIDGDTESQQKAQSEEVPKQQHKKPQNDDKKDIGAVRQAQTAVEYIEPPWSGISEEKYSFEVIKNGAVIEMIDLSSKPFHVIGRLPSCDITLEHPSLSRYHSVIQYSNGDSDLYPKGWYLFDLDSTHGTWINKNKVPQQKYHRLHVDYVVKFGGSTRLLTLLGPDTDRQEESELSVVEMKEQREKQAKEADLLRQAELAEEERKAEILKKQQEDKGCSWGFDEEVTEEDETEVNPFSLGTENEELYIQDPKKSLNGFFEREGHDAPEYEFTDAGSGKRKCSVELPVDGPNGEPLTAEVVISGKKKEAVIACALEACRLLDRHGLLRKSTHESRKKKGKNWEDDDFYDSDEDVFLDRTGTIEKKRQYRMTKTGKGSKTTETYETLLEKHGNIIREISEIEAKLEEAKAQAAALKDEDMDELDAYMTAIKSGVMDTKTKMKLKRQLLELKHEEQSVRKLVNIAKPASLPALAPAIKPTLSGLLVGKMKGVHGKSVKKIVIPVAKAKKVDADNENIVEEEDEDEEDNEIKKPITDTDDNTKNNVPQNTGEKNPHVSKSKGVELSKSISDTVKQQATPRMQENVSKMKCPTLPLSAVLAKLQNQVDDMDDVNDTCMPATEMKPRATKRNVTRENFGSETKRAKGKDSQKRTGVVDDESGDPDYASWLPPQNQSGDGKTHLNDRFGY